MIVYGGEIVLTKKASGYAVKLRVTQGHIIFDGSNDENWSFTGTRFIIPIIDMYSQASRTKVVANRGVFDSSSTSDGTIFGYNGSLYYYLSSITSLSDFKTWLSSNNLDVVYPLATPIEIDLTDASDIVALVGTNNVWSDTGDMEVEYYAAVTDNLEQTSKSRAAAKAEKELKEKQEKELKELDEKETIKEPTKEIGETKK